MYQEKIYSTPFKISDFKSRETVRDTLMCCSCGHTTYLNRPCGFCGSTKRKNYFRMPKKYGFLGYSMCTVGISMLAAVFTAAFFSGAVWAVLLFLTMLGMLGFTLYTFLKIDDKQLEAYWTLHAFNRKRLKSYGRIHKKGGSCGIRSVDSEIQEVIMDAYYSDLNQLEQVAFDAEAKTDTGREEWISILEDTRKLSYIYSNVRLSRLQFKVMLHLSPQDIMLVDLNHTCAFLTVLDIEPSEMWHAWHFLGDYLLLADYTDCNEVKRMFDAVVSSILFSRQSSWGKPTIPYGEEQIMANLLAICGADVFRKAWPEQKDCLQNGKIVVPNDADAMIRLAEKILDFSIVRHDLLLSTGNWLYLILNLREMNHLAMKKLGAGLERQYCFAWTGSLDEAGKKIMKKERPEGYSGMYSVWRDEGLRQVPVNVFTMLLPEEMIFVSQVWNHCIYNAFGICYQDMEELKIGRLINLFSEYGYFRSRIEECWKQAGEILKSENNTDITEDDE